ncbi:ABC transporter permease [Vespertiliibacter pulmonis]|uniref:ABC-type uncharacterized transport system permease subunit n=1 Tax=Vespertiliibacter pulmonis TaxID=1443036 RepID=A0A3N4VRA1_9PAST|nr:cytochrome c biogenesis protein CcsA [Vespertiliibacter pulmonis]QLB21046.1 ABC transporter permease [Vespertiliibacter pulmonis]RPE83855.1 ABC-type uncharacterized transport system permease subunit [Vespertiliibacter pulmonis]
MLSAILTILAYCVALLWIVPTIAYLDFNQKPNVKAVLCCGVFAVICHLINVSHYFFVNEGQNLTIVNIGSLLSVCISAVATIALIRWRSIWFPLSIIYLLGIITVVLSTFLEGSLIKQLSENTGLMWHLATAIFSYGLFFIALLYAIQLRWLNGRLKSKRVPFSPILPPLMTVERHFLTLTLVAQLFLTITLITGSVYLHNFFAPEQIHKAIFSFMAWIVYGFLLLGLWQFHWRGNRVLIYSISGIMLLTVAYFGSRLG